MWRVMRVWRLEPRQGGQESLLQVQEGGGCLDTVAGTGQHGDQQEGAAHSARHGGLSEVTHCQLEVETGPDKHQQGEDVHRDEHQAATSHSQQREGSEAGQADQQAGEGEDVLCLVTRP